MTEVDVTKRRPRLASPWGGVADVGIISCVHARGHATFEQPMPASTFSNIVRSLQPYMSPRTIRCETSHACLLSDAPCTVVFAYLSWMARVAVARAVAVTPQEPLTRAHDMLPSTICHLRLPLLPP